MDRPRVFVRHSNLDNEFTERLVEDLRAGGADVWVDYEKIASGSFSTSINEGLGTCEWLILVQTPNALKSKWVRREVDAAINLETNDRLKGVIPILAVPCVPGSVPPTWDILHRYDATIDYPHAVNGILKAIGLPPLVRAQGVVTAVSQPVTQAGDTEPSPQLAPDPNETIAPRVSLTLSPSGTTADQSPLSIPSSDRLFADSAEPGLLSSSVKQRLRAAKKDFMVALKWVLVALGAVVVLFLVIGLAGTAVERLSGYKSSGDTSLASPSKGGLNIEPSAKLGASGLSKRGNLETVLIPAGYFLMGDDDQKNNPRHRVYLDAFRIGKTPVTVGQFKAYCLDKGIDFGAFRKPDWGWIDDHPMVNVTWQQARDFCRWAGGELPTEAQWEKAARGTDGRKYPWGNEWDGSRLHWGSDGSAGSAEKTSVVTAHPTGASPFGCLDMAGNVWQWCSDWYADKMSGPDRNPLGPATGTSRVLRGGSWFNGTPDYFRSALRFSYVPSDQYYFIGFRLAGPL